MRTACYTSQVVTTTSADGLTVTTQSDLVGDADFDGTRTVTTVKNADGSSTVTETNESADGTLLSKLVTTTSADGLSKTIQADTNGDGTFEVTTTDVTVVNPDTSRVQTVTERFTSGALKSKIGDDHQRRPQDRHDRRGRATATAPTTGRRRSSPRPTARWWIPSPASTPTGRCSTRR